ncbi:hypothetical protein [Ureibacillus manganicus]|uniref:Uncharacterized protein n=1 Tax=Ureibacillus manganicus DSM 26584 TaxID=1384049 RepID=A0A0A3IPH1_9BACL|nr:hypothetical protein [Ureibacillus manganicus]KGR76737.1 hypothetical protein CD29_16480 [Ureibacillus manganicus DSM 26584]
MFIELTLSDGTKTLINKNHIVHVWEEKGRDYNSALETILDTDGSYYFIKEYYEDIKQMLID